MNKKSVIVYTGAVARHLLKDEPGRFKIIDVAPNRHDPEKKSSVFIFEYAEGIYEAIKQITEAE